MSNLRLANAVAEPPAGDVARRPARRGLDVLVMVLCAVALGLILGAAASAGTASSASVGGKVMGGGWGGAGCYPTVSYTVDGRDYVLHANKDTRWCALHMMGPAKVYYERDDPARARLDRYGELPWQLVCSAMLFLVVAAFLSTRRRADANPPVVSAGFVRGRQGRVPRLLVLLLILGWLATTAAVLVLGERRSTLNDLQAAIDRGDVSEVSERGAAMWGQRDTSRVHLAWTSDGLRRFADVVQLRGRSAEKRAPVGADDVIVGDLAEQLSNGGGEVRVQPDLRTTAPRLVGFAPWGWHVYGWPVYATVFLLLITLRVLVVADRTRRASRWGWFWLLAAAPIPVSLVYLCFGGPTGWKLPDGDSRRLGGVSAFLLAAVLAALQQIMT